MTRTIPRSAPEVQGYEWMRLEAHHTHAIVRSTSGMLCWQEQPGVNDLVDKLGPNDLWRLFRALGHGRNSEFLRHLYRCMGYTLHGYWEIFHWPINNPEADRYLPPSPDLPGLRDVLGERFDLVHSKALAATLNGAEHYLLQGHAAGLRVAMEAIERQMTTNQPI